VKALDGGFLKAESIKSAPYVNLSRLDMWIRYAAGVAAQSKTQMDLFFCEIAAVNFGVDFPAKKPFSLSKHVY
jgi:hypothetical protein